MFVTNAVGHESSGVLDSPGPATRNAEVAAVPDRRRCALTARVAFVWESAPIEGPVHRVIHRTVLVPTTPKSWRQVRGLEPDCLPVASGIARREVAVVESPDRLAAPELVVVVDDDQFMAALPQPVQRVRRESTLDADL